MDLYEAMARIKRLEEAIDQIAGLSRWEPSVSTRTATEGRFCGMVSDEQGEWLSAADVLRIVRTAQGRHWL